MTANPAAQIAPGSAELEHERLKSLINSMADGVIATDAHTKIAVYNGAALNILDVNSPVQGRRLSSVLKLIDKNNQPVDTTELVLKTKTQIVNRDLRLCYPDTSTINLHLSIAPVHLGYGGTNHTVRAKTPSNRGGDNRKGYVLLMRDITHEKSLEEERDEFIGVVSHELRTPVANAEGNLSNAAFLYSKVPNASSSVLESLHQAHDQILFLSGLINDLATLSRAERDKLKVEVKAINPHDLVEDLVRTYSKDVEAKGLKLRTDLDPSLEILQSSFLYVREILQNFITNAIKYTEKGSITIGADTKPHGVEFFVQDTGIGITKPDQEKVFDKFFRSEDFRIRQTSGTGLGLYVTMKLARLLHAELDLTSQLNKGSTFRVFVPNLK